MLLGLFSHITNLVALEDDSFIGKNFNDAVKFEKIVGIVKAKVSV